MSTNEVSRPADSGQSAVAPEQSLSSDIFDTMIQAYKEKQYPITDATTGGASTKEILDSKQVPDENIKEFLAANAKGGEHCDLIARVNAADATLANNPLIHQQIAKLELQSMQLRKQSWQQEDNLRDTARNTFSKTDWRKLSELGPNPLEDGFGKKIPFDFNKEQRAWLKENHPDVYKLVEKHDRTSLERTNTNASLHELGETRDAPINARIKFARYQHANGMGDAAIETLTEAINTRPSIVTRQHKGDEFRSLAIQTGAAFNPAFRNAVEHSGGDIMDFVHRPAPEKHLIPKQIDFNPQKLK
jgi:hypothetical protein